MPLMPQTIFCPGCGEGVSTGVAACPACGTVLPQPAPEPPAYGGGAGGPTVADHSPHGWMESAQTPPRPVTPIPSALPPPYQPPAVRPQTFTCPGCGRVIPLGVSFCPQCGRNLQQSAQQFSQHNAPPPPFGTPPPLPGARSKNDQMLIILLAVIAACIILGFFC